MAVYQEGQEDSRRQKCGTGRDMCRVDTHLTLGKHSERAQRELDRHEPNEEPGQSP